MEDKQPSGKVSIVFSLVSIFVLIVFVVGVTYAAFTYTKEGKTENTLNTGTLVFNYTESSDGISLINAEPMDDDTGKNLVQNLEDDGIVQGYFDFYLKTKVPEGSAIKYEIYGIDVSDENALDSQYVKVYLTSVNNTNEEPLENYTESVPTFYSLNNSTAMGEGTDPKIKTIYSGTFNETQTKNFRLRIWVAENYEGETVSPEVPRNFAMKINVKAYEDV